MFSYIIARVVSINKKTITVETNEKIGYVINVACPEDYVVGQEEKIYLHESAYLNNKNYLTCDLYGFIKYEQKKFFLDCIAISGIGAKTAINFLKNPLDVLTNLIKQKDVEALSQLSNISKKSAYILIDYLSSKQTQVNENNSQQLANIGDVMKVLKSLGYGQEEITFAMQEITNKTVPLIDQETSSIVSAAIKLISSKNEAQINKA